MRGFAIVGFFISSLIVAASCGSSPSSGSIHGGSGDTKLSDAAPPPDSATTQDSAAPVDSSVADGKTDSEGRVVPDTELADEGSAPDIGADVSATDLEAVDTSQADTEAPDVAQAPDTGSSCPYVCDLDCQCKKDFDGCDLPECESGTCLQIMTEANQLLADAATGCTASSQCTTFEFPICDSFGCFQGPVNGSNDLQSLGEVALQGLDAQCSGFHCGCGPAPKPTVCFEGACIDCKGASACSDCNQLTSLIEQDAAYNAAGCKTDDDCEFALVDQCGMGPHIMCHAYAYNKAKGPGKVLELMSLFTHPDNACPWTQCDCQGSGAHCEQGMCVPGM